MYDPDQYDDGHLDRHLDRQVVLFWRVALAVLVAAWIGAAVWVWGF